MDVNVSDVCRHCGRRIWWMDDYTGWAHAHSWALACYPSARRPCAEPTPEQVVYGMSDNPPVIDPDATVIAWTHERRL